MVETKVVEKNKTHTLCPTFCFYMS